MALDPLVLAYLRMHTCISCNPLLKTLATDLCSLIGKGGSKGLTRTTLFVSKDFIHSLAIHYKCHTICIYVVHELHCHLESLLPKKNCLLLRMHHVLIENRWMNVECIHKCYAAEMKEHT